MPDPEADYTIDIDWREAEVIDDRRPSRPRPAPEPWNGDDDEDDDGPAIAPKADRELAAVQLAGAKRAAKAAGAEDAPKEGAVIEAGNRITFLGKDFRIAERVGLMPLLKFASSADVDTTDPRALSAMYALLRDCIYEGRPPCGECAECEADNDGACKSYDRGDWGAFEEHAMITKADADDLLDVVTKVLELVSGRPQQPRSGSSAGPRRTQRASTGRSSGRGARGSRR